jgi:hypothetical protein
LVFQNAEYFVAAAEELNFTHAADRLQVSQPPSASKFETWKDLFLRGFWCKSY